MGPPQAPDAEAEMLSRLETKGAESALFFRHWLRHPLEMGAFLPSSSAVGRAMAKAAALDPPRAGGSFLQLTNALVSPVAMTALDLSGSEIARIWSQFPPVQIWRYQRKRGVA